MRKVKRLLQKAFTPITIMLIPHSDGRPLRFKIPSIGILLSIVLWVTGMAYVFHTAVNTAEYNKMKIKLNYYSSQFLELRSTMYTLRETESELANKEIFISPLPRDGLPTDILLLHTATGLIP
ncbi:MAG: hypothetical protein P8013_08455 [Candidatus Sulfobium sp.]